MHKEKMNIELNILREIGIKYNENLQGKYKCESIIAGAINTYGQVVFCDRNMLYVGEFEDDSLQIKNSVNLPKTEIVDICFFDDCYYCLTYKDKRTKVYRYSNDLLLEEVYEITDDGIPLCISAKNLIYIGFYKGYCKCFNLAFELIEYRDFKKYGIVTPTDIQVLSKGLLITDGYMNVVCEINNKGLVVNTVGELGNNECIYWPSCGTKTKNNTYLVCERRNHIVCEYNLDGEKIWQYGICGRAGIVKNRLWDPIDIWPYKNGFLVVFGQGRCLVYISKDKTEYRIMYGKSIMERTDLNYPRTCEYSEQYDCLVVANTALNEVIIYKDTKKIVINEANGLKFNNPRMVKWYSGGLIVADTRNCRIVYFRKDRRVEIHDLDKLGIKDWIMGFDIYEKNILLLFKNYLLVLAMDDATVLWDSRSINYSFKDLHQAEWFGESEIAVANTGCNEIAIINIHTNRFIHFNSIVYGHKKITLKNPRLIRKINGNVYLINSANSDIYELDANVFHRVKKIVTVSERDLYSKSCLKYPRWMCKGKNDEFYITDTENQRVVVAKI